jgi:hypothetical protein
MPGAGTLANDDDDFLHEWSQGSISNEVKHFVSNLSVFSVRFLFLFPVAPGFSILISFSTVKIALLVNHFSIKSDVIVLIQFFVAFSHVCFSFLPGARKRYIGFLLL